MTIPNGSTGILCCHGSNQESEEAAKYMPNKGLVEKLKYEDADKKLRELTGGRGLDAVDMFKNIGWLKNGMDEQDPYYIFQINCREINNEPSYVFKTSDLALQLALKWTLRYKMISQAEQELRDM